MVENHGGARPCKRARRSNRVTADLSDFLSSPPAVASGKPFRDAVRIFLSSHARATTVFPPPVLPSLMTWQILFRVGDLADGLDSSPAVVALDVVEEDVTRSSRSVYCDQCRVVGWSGHPVCRKRFHFIVRSDNGGGTDGYEKFSSRCGNSLQLSDSRLKGCSSEVNADDIEEWVYSQIEDNTHLLHGVVHSNGYGHLLTVNGREGGSRILSGFDIMNFWDRLCTTLSVRKVTVMDVSKKYGIEYRLLHSIVEGHSWYGNWGYEFGSGSYALTMDAYKKAVHTLSSMPLSTILLRGRSPQTRLRNIIGLYQSLSDLKLLTLKDLFSFLLRLIRRSHTSINPKKLKTFDHTATSGVCTWTRDDVQRVQQAMIKVLMTVAGESGWVARRALKGVMFKTASRELIDYCVKHLGGNVAANGLVVQSRCNPNSSDMEFRLQQLNSPHHQSSLPLKCPSEEQIKGDMKFLFDTLFHSDNVKNGHQAMRDHVVDSATKLLDCKQFIKDYKPNTNNPDTVCLWCYLELSDQPKEDPVPPPELIVLPRNATVADLKNEATKVFEEVYAMFKRLRVDELLDYGSIEDDITLTLLVGTSGSVRIRGRCQSKYGLNRFRMERGTENWTVDCPCGAKDDDGERMLACDVCSVWQHTRCAGIDNSNDIPAKYICMRCKN